MYGLINISIKNLVEERFGEKKWQEICAEAGLKMDIFISNKTYDDSITYDLVGASAKVLQLPAEQILKEFGKYWVLKVAPEGYGKLLDAGGKTFEDFLLNLPNFHSRVILIYPKVRPPEFKVEKLKDNSLMFTYQSERPGLLPFVEGLLEGLAQRFSVKISIQHLGQSHATPGGHDLLIRVE